MRAFIRKIDNSPYEDPSNLCLFDGKSMMEMMELFYLLKIANKNQPGRFAIIEPSRESTSTMPLFMR